MKNKDISRRKFIKLFGAGSLATVAAVTGCKKATTADGGADDYKNQVEPPKGKMTYRVDPHTQKQISLLGYGMMRLPTMSGNSSREGEDPIDQEQVNRLVDYAIEHGVNYFDTSPA